MDEIIRRRLYDRACECGWDVTAWRKDRPTEDDGLEYFTVANLRRLNHGECDLSQGDLDEIADAVIETDVETE